MTPEHALLCESCGYTLDNLPEDRPCPECGRPIATSVPAARQGSAWQRRPGILAWRNTAVALLHSPRVAMRSLGFDRSAKGLLALNLAIAAAGLALAAHLIFRNVPIQLPQTAWMLNPWSIAVVAAGFGLVLSFLTWIEIRGLMFFGARHGFRITPRISTVVCAHASIGWVFAGLLAVFFAGVGVRVFASVRWGNPLVGAWIARSVPLAGFFAGMIIFETLAWIGMRQCKFANRPAP